MKRERGVRRKGDRWFAQIHMKGGESESFALGRYLDEANTKVAAIREAIFEKGKTPDEVRAALKAGRDPRVAEPAAPAGPVPLPLPGQTVAEVADRWLRERVEVELETRNASIIRSRLERCIIPFLGARTIASIKRADCHAFKGYMRTTRPDLKSSSLHHYLRDMRELLAWAEEVELTDSNPWPRRRIMPRREKRAPDRLSDEQYRVLVALPEHWGFTLRFLLSTGLRWGEAVRARRRDIEGGQLLVRKSKSGKPRRVPLSRSILKEIMQLGNDWIVPRQRHAPGGRAERSSSAFNLTIRRLVAKHVETLNAETQEPLADLEGFHAHQCRHTFACRYLEAGGELANLKEILGHASVEQTEQYGRTSEKSIRADALRVHEAWERAETA